MVERPGHCAELAYCSGHGWCLEDRSFGSDPDDIVEFCDCQDNWHGAFCNVSVFNEYPAFPASVGELLLAEQQRNRTSSSTGSSSTGRDSKKSRSSPNSSRSSGQGNATDDSIGVFDKRRNTHGVDGLSNSEVVACTNNENGTTSDCGQHGICVAQQCYCSHGFIGPHCGIRSCPNNCFGHGTCVDGDCACDFGWTGQFCAQQTCSTTDSSVGESGNRNDNRRNRKKRTIGRAQEDCDACSEHCQQPRGLCDGLCRCLCSNGWTGFYCNESVRVL